MTPSMTTTSDKKIQNTKQKWIAVELIMGGRSIIIIIIIKTCEKNVNESITKCKNPNQCTWSLFYSIFEERDVFYSKYFL
jgi:hypothetical protein